MESVCGMTAEPNVHYHLLNKAEIQNAAIPSARYLYPIYIEYQSVYR